MNNNCPKCNINLDIEDYKTIKIRNNNLLSLKILFKECSLNNNIEELKYCDLCGASISEIVLDGLN